MSEKPSLHIEADKDALASAARDLVVQLANEAVRQRGRFTIALSGGSTPKKFHELLAASPDVPWAQMHFFFGDDRHVPPDHADSNFKMATETLFSRAPIPKENIHRIHGEEPDAHSAADMYELEMKKFFGSEDFPRFDVQILGLGDDGHTASLFPGTAPIHEAKRWVIGNWVEKKNSWRITMTPPVLNATRAVVFLVQGAEKAPAVQEVLEGKKSVDEIPAKAVRPEPGGLFWFLDNAAAGKLSDVTLGRKKLR